MPRGAQRELQAVDEQLGRLKPAADGLASSEARRRTLEEQREALRKLIQERLGAYAEAAFRRAGLETPELRAMFADVVRRAYRRYVELDAAAGQDVVRPLLDCAHIMELAAKHLERTLTPVGAEAAIAGEVLLDLSYRRFDEIRAGENPTGFSTADVEGEHPRPADVNRRPCGTAGRHASCRAPCGWRTGACRSADRGRGRPERATPARRAG